MKKSYKTVDRRACAYFEEKKSKFLSRIFPVENEDEALKFIDEMRREYPDATHTVYAYSIDRDVFIQRFSDDGEPSGTAGIPVLEVIKRNGLENVLITVTRYFGGTQLGAPGLTRAYSSAAALAVEKSTIVTRVVSDVITFIIDYSFIGKVQNKIENEGYPIDDTKYSLDVELTVIVPEDRSADFTDTIMDICNGNCIYELKEKTYYSFD